MNLSADLLNCAADLIEAHGWVQGSFGSSEGGFCALGAIRHVVAATLGGGVEAASAFNDTRSVLMKHIGARSVVNWNDDFARTKDDVVATLRGAACQ